MAEARKTDNKSMGAKLALRRYFLRKYHADGTARVLDCCQGEGYLWRALRTAHEIADYWGIDQKHKGGRLQADSSRILQLEDLNYDVFDIDTYGSPWKHWMALIEHGPVPATVFLTVGQVYMGTDKTLSDALGFMGLKVPSSIVKRLHSKAFQAILTKAEEFGKICQEVVEAESGGNAKYYGIRLESMTGDRSQPAATTHTEINYASRVSDTDREVSAINPVGSLRTEARG